MKGLHRTLPMGLLIALSACRSEPIHYHTLTPVFSDAHARNTSDSAIIVQSVNVPAQVDRNQIVVRKGESGLVLLESDWWGATLADEMKSALIDQLTQAPHSSAPAGKPAESPAMVRVDVRRFDSVPGHYALIDAEWRVIAAKNDRRVSQACASVQQTAAGDSVDSLVAAQQQNVRQLAEHIAAGVERWRAGGSACP